ncbi:MAG TPA: HDIG domain-containing protein [Aggregatilineales bacterium]|nr:HDIG domain-containing protein [Aggregatilineales bacterium]
MVKPEQQPNIRRTKLILFGVVFILVATVTIAYPSLTSSGVVLAVGQVAPNDILAPRSITYDSAVLSHLARQSASDAVSPVYDPPNPSVSRQQIQLARRVLDYIDNVRHDSYATPAQRTADLKAIAALKLDDDTLTSLLAVSDDAWKQIDSQVISVVERIMQAEVREDRLDEIAANLPNLISVNIEPPQDHIITAIAKDLIKPNAFYNEQRTQQARDNAAKAVATETRSFVEGQIIVRAGTIVSEADMEALAQLNLLQLADRRANTFVGALVAVLIIGTLGVVYLRRLHVELFHTVPHVVLIGSIFLVTLAGARVFGAVNDFQSHLYPAAAFALVAVALAGPEVAIVMSGGLAALIGLVNGASLEFAVLTAIASTAGVLSLRRAERLNAYFVAGLVVAGTNVTGSIIFLLIQGPVDPVRLLVILTAGIFNGILAAGLAVVGLYVVSTLLNLPTSVRLIELSQPSQPLLQRLLREAPGTYQHSLLVANLAEVAAERIGAHAELVRVAALYHDVGKLVNPHFFVENQIDGQNAHNALDDPLRSAQIIIGHVCDGEKLAHQYNLPKAIIDFILQHHGTMPVLYFYREALKQVDCDETRVNKADFLYPGPRPQSRETAVLMLADASESTVRSKRPGTRQEIEAIVHEAIESRRAEGQLDESGLTMKDIKTIEEMFVANLQGVFHPRIAYPAAPVVASLGTKALGAKTREVRS